MRLFVGAAFSVLGTVMALLGGRMALSGKNFSGLLGRGLTNADAGRLARAPAAYFRAIGSTVFSFAVLLRYAVLSS